MGWQEFSDALDRFKGIGLGTIETRRVIGRRGPVQVCRYCALGAAHRALGHDGLRDAGEFIKGAYSQFGHEVPCDVVKANDHFMDGSTSRKPASNDCGTCAPTRTLARTAWNIRRPSAKPKWTSITH